MSSLRANTERQARRHKPALTGIGVAYFLGLDLPAGEQANPS
jgi:hypothetical protein